MKTTKRLSALLVALFMLVSMFSIGASAWETGEGIEVYWNDTLEGTVTYDQILDDISRATKKVTYSAVNKKGTYTAYNTYA
ncbi:MAG: hypothetical protein IIZ60_04655, partial [Clostridia bacterium]|nr:hypothetical protein [Clostridia bacterium]